MLFVIDIGNTNIKFGIFDGDNLKNQATVSTDRNKTSDEYAVEIYNIFKIHNIDRELITDSVISSVVPQITSRMKKAVYYVTKIDALVVGPGVKTGLNIKIDNPSSTGSDLVASAVAATALYPTPCIVLGLGTATTMIIVDQNKAMLGGALLPGVSISLNALTSTSALLSDVALEAPENVIGKNTNECLRSGLILGTASLIDGMIERFENEIKQKCTIVAMGGLAPMIIGNCMHDIILRQDLIFQGLKIIHNINKNKRKN